MKIAFVGKGGSGKTTIAALLCRFLASRGEQVLAVDSDINQHLGKSLGFSIDELKGMPSLGVETEKLQSYLLGSNNRVGSLDDFIRTTPPTAQSNFIRPFEGNELFDYFAKDKNSIKLLTVGQPPDDQIGRKCYHSNMGSASMLLNHLIDDENEYVVVDLTAGVDTVVSGIFVSYDVVFVVVEPTIKSLEVFLGYRDYLSRLEVPIGIIPIANKVFNEQDIDFIEKVIGFKPELVINFSPFVRKSERGDWVDFKEIEKETLESLNKIVENIKQQKKDWQGFYDGLIKFHLRKAEGEKKDRLIKQIDESFDIVDKVQEVLRK